MSSPIQIIAQCLCASHKFTASVLPSSLPLKGRICHCTSCRHVSGALSNSTVPWPGPISEIVNSTLSSYKFSEVGTARFCGTCSSLVAFHIHPPKGSGEPESVMVGTGILSNNHPGLVEITSHIFVGDTIDGGATVWLDNLKSDENAQPIRRWTGWENSSEELPPSWSPQVSSENATEIPIRCHCKGVNLLLKRGKYTDKLPWFVEPTSHKLLAGFDACNSCRTSFSVSDITTWTFSLLENIDFAVPADASAPNIAFPKSSLDLKKAVLEGADSRLGTLKFFASSQDVQRYFCSTCSASVFYAADDRPEMVDVSVGLLDSQCGARVHSWLEWAFGVVIWSDDAIGGWREELVNAVQRNTETYRIKNSIPKVWKRIEEEEKKEKDAAAATSLSS
ncbi:hypothetical protein QQS21_005018 [Conoideocrella luteorostrata]|uniref:CENP-V/GFA domain-containing protein n=1 Tax=Conoideocrella luteorostrata TaxID=1105319 RepID=A0AAJ0CQG0_9HYPO|nr:hypothetical protein QQS21_005018 [Conoideocrella luteorostrata]